MAIIGYESHRVIKIPFTFTGAAGAGANGSYTIVETPIPYLDRDEFVSDVFYRVTTTLTSGDLAGTYLKVGITVDDDDCILTSTTGILNTLNGNATGIKITPAYTESTIDARNIIAAVGGTNDITGGAMEIIITVTRGDGVSA